MTSWSLRPGPSDPRDPPPTTDGRASQDDGVNGLSRHGGHGPDADGKAPKAPGRSHGVVSDIRNFLLHTPARPTLITFGSTQARQDYSQRILQRLGVSVTPYAILNIHKIGIEAPVRYIFEELLQWNGDSTCWPNHIARVDRVGGRLESIRLHTLGWSRYPGWLSKILRAPGPPPLFCLNALDIQRAPQNLDCDNARYLLYECCGGYPIGFFSMYVRSSIADEGEREQAQLFLLVGFNFYGKVAWSGRNLVNRTWECLHDRVTANVMNRFRQLCEWRFQRIREDRDHTSSQAP